MFVINLAALCQNQSFAARRTSSICRSIGS